MAKKLIEVALPLEKINAESAREKSIRHGHPSTLHLWWARRPLAAARAVIWSSLVDDPSSHPEKFPTEEDQNNERQRLFKILEQLVVWENSNNEAVLSAAKKEIMRSTDGNPPALLDPFAGGGAIPLEAQRLGLEAHAHDLNPVAVMINRSMIDIPSRFINMPAVNSNNRISKFDNSWNGLKGLSSDVKYYGEWLKKEAYIRIGHLYPYVASDFDQNNKMPVISWIWARTVRCPNPTCKCEFPLTSSFVLSKKKGHEAWIEPIASGDKYRYRIHHGKYSKETLCGTKKGKKALFCCPKCKVGVVNGDYIDKEANQGNLGHSLMAIVAEGKKGRQYFEPDRVSIDIIKTVNEYYDEKDIADKVPHASCLGTFASNAMGRRYGFYEFKDYFTKRQQIAIVTFNELIKEVRYKIEAEAVIAKYKNDGISLNSGGNGAKAYSEAVALYLTFALNKAINMWSSLVGWMNDRGAFRETFARQAIPMVWDYAEANPFSNSAGNFSMFVERCADTISYLPVFDKSGIAIQFDAQKDCGLSKIMVSTDPPYYGNIDYSDLSDFFYVWMRETQKSVFPELFNTMLVPKSEELIANPYRYGGDSEKAKLFFEDGMFNTCKLINHYSCEDIPVTIYYAYKQSDSINDEKVNSGWETMLNAIIKSGFTITGTWPVRTESTGRSIAQGTNALSSSIVLVCRKRPKNALQTTRRNLINIIRRELQPALKRLQESNIAPVDLAQSAIGPGMGVFSRYKCVLESDGSIMTVRDALQLINEEIDLYFNEQVGNMDAASRFCIDLYLQNAYNDIKYGDADILANAKGTSIPMMSSRGVLYAKAGNVHLIERNELPEEVDINENNIWMLTQQLTHAMATGGVEACAKIVASMFGSNAEKAKDLAYRLYTIAEQKKWANEAYAYNALVVAWPDIQSRAASLKEIAPEQLNLFDLMDDSQ